jgi:hypothetical protein
VFTARYGLNPYVTQIRFFFKGLNLLSWPPENYVSQNDVFKGLNLLPWPPEYYVIQNVCL